MVRTHPVHTLISDVPAVILVFLCFDSLERRFVPVFNPLVRSITRCLVVAVAVLVVANGIRIVALRDAFIDHIAVASTLPDLPSIGLFSTDSNRIEAALYVIGATRPEERILSATGRHDKIFVNDIIFYFLVHRLPGTRWHHYDPGVQTTKEVQRQMIRELEGNAVSVIVRDTRWDGKSEPNKSAESSGVTLLDDYIALQYQEVRKFGSITVHRRVE